jgi:hypothetical protein
MSICIVVHTHSEYSDIWPVVFDRLKKYGPNYDLYVLSNKNVDYVDSTILYDEIMPFSQRILLLKDLSYNYILLIRDTDILVGPTDTEKLLLLEKTLVEHSIDSLRLNNSGVDDTDLINHIDNDIYAISINCPYLFSLYPTIWKKEVLLEIMNEFINYKYYDLESDAVNNFCKRYYNCFVYNIRCRIRQHNERYAHIIKFVHILQHGKWTYVHDPLHVMSISEEYSIDLTKRGFHMSGFRRPSQTNSWNPYLNS